MTILTIVILVIIILYIRRSFIDDPKKWKRTKFELKMLWMGTKGNYQDAIMQSFNHVCKFYYVKRTLLFEAHHMTDEEIFKKNLELIFKEELKKVSKIFSIPLIIFFSFGFFFDSL